MSRTKVAASSQSGKSARKLVRQFPFPDPNIAENMEGYAQFVFSRIAFPKNSPCAVVKNGRFLPRGDLNLVGLREHAEGQSILSVALAEKKIGHTKTVCVTFKEPELIPAIGLGCRLLSSAEQSNLDGVIELCPYDSVRIWIFFAQPIPVAEALKTARVLKKRAFLSGPSKVFPSGTGDDTFLVLPPHPDPRTGKWSLVLNLKQAEDLLDGRPYSRKGPNWADFASPPEKGGEEETDDSLMAFLSDNYREGWTELSNGSSGEKETGTKKAKANTEREPSIEGGKKGLEDRKGTMAKENPEQENPAPSPDSGDASRTQPIHAMSNLVPTVIGRLLDTAPMAIPSPSGVLNDVLNGGWGVGQVHLLVGPSGEGKSTLCGWTSDFSANNRIPVLFVSFQNTCQQLAMFALARTAQIDSSHIVGRKWMDPNCPDAGALSKSIIGAGRNYFRTGDYLQILDPEGPLETDRIEDAIRETRSISQLGENDPILVVIDSIREVIPRRFPKGRVDSCPQSSIPQAMIELKRIASRRQAAIVATLDVRSNNLSRLEWVHSSNVENESDYLSVTPFADVVLLLESRPTRLVNPTKDGGPPTEEHRLLDPLDHLLEENGHHPVLAKRIQEIRKSFPLNAEAASTYCRLAVLKNRAGRTQTHPLFRYDRAYHDFEPIPLDNYKILMEVCRASEKDADPDEESLPSTAS